mmetsp:Transcript_70926/g.178840  ORF Transcript_70926/g.178840 Transcript_70926/m.178840 type:complete len:348 (+) Transcript_70926:759-1802(+)
MSGFSPPSWRTECCTVSSWERFQMTPAAFSTMFGCSESIKRISRLTAPAWAIAKRFSCVSARESKAPKQFSTAGTKVENSNTLSKKGIPPAFRIVVFMVSTTDKFQSALAAFSCSTSSVGLPMHWISALTPPASAMASAHSSWAPMFVKVIDVTARNVSGKLAFNKGTSFEMPSSSRMTSLLSSSTARFSTAPAAARRASSGTPGSKRASSDRTPSSSRIFVRYTPSLAKFPKHSADLPTMTMSVWFSISTRARRPSCLKISALLSSSTLAFFKAPAAARIQSSVSEVSILTRWALPPSCLMVSLFSLSRAKFSMQFAARSLVRGGPTWLPTRSTIFLIAPASLIAV